MIAPLLRIMTCVLSQIQQEVIEILSEGNKNLRFKTLLSKVEDI
jgi:hypothetical protein